MYETSPLSVIKFNIQTRLHLLDVKHTLLLLLHAKFGANLLTFIGRDCLHTGHSAVCFKHLSIQS